MMSTSDINTENISRKVVNLIVKLDLCMLKIVTNVQIREYWLGRNSNLNANV